jgi:beta-glucosidase
MSDWFGTYSVSEAIEAGLDLEMPGPPRWRNLTLINACLGARKLTADALDDRVRGVLNFVQKVAKWGPKGENAEIVYGDGKEGTIDTPQRREEARRLAAEGCVLLKNEKAVLPIEKGAKKVAVIGPNADAKVISGGGSAALKPTYVVNPLKGLVDNAPAGVDITYSVGSYGKAT